MQLCNAASERAEIAGDGKAMPINVLLRCVLRNMVSSAFSTALLYVSTEVATFTKDVWRRGLLQLFSSHKFKACWDPSTR